MFLRSILILFSHLTLTVLKALLPFSILATWPTHINLLDLTLSILGERYNYEVSHFGAFSTPHSHPSWAQIFTSGPYFIMRIYVFKIKEKAYLLILQLYVVKIFQAPHVVTLTAIWIPVPDFPIMVVNKTWIFYHRVVVTWTSTSHLTSSWF